MHCYQHATVFRSALGWAAVAVTGQGVSRVVLPKRDKAVVERALLASKCGVQSGDKSGPANLIALKKAVKALQKYLSGEHVSFDLPLDMRYYTAFQQAVWHAAAEIPFGETRPYAWIAKRIRNPRAVRAVGQAMGANPVPVIIP